MAGEIIRPSALPDRPVPVASEKVPVDNGSSVGGTTIEALVNAGRPLASQAEAEAGTQATHAMTPLTGKQQLHALGDVRFASAAQGALADAALRSIVGGSGITVDATDPQNPTLTYSGAGVSDGDKGDIEVSGSGVAWEVKPITFVKLSDALVQTDAEGGDEDADDEIPTVKRVATMVADLAPSFFITPEDFGCIGDGVVDDTAAFDTALDAAIAAGAVLMLGQNKTYLLNTWPSAGYDATGVVRITGVGKNASIKGPATTSYFLRPADQFLVDGVMFERWTGIIYRAVADGGDIAGAQFTNNECTGITGIPVNIECPFADSVISRNKFVANSGGFQIRIGSNTFALQDTWTRNEISHNTIRSITASGTTSGFAIIAYGKDTKILFNTIIGLTATDGEAIGIYTKLRDSQIIGNRIEDMVSTGGSGAALDNVGISIKGGGRSYAGPGVQGYGCIVADNIVVNIGTQIVKGTGIRVQTEFCTVANNLVRDTGLIGINNDETGGSNDNLIIGNRVEGFNKLGTFGILVSTYGTGHKVIGNTVVDFTQGIRVSSAGGFPITNTKIAENSIRSTRATSFGVLIAGASGAQGVIIMANDFALTGATSTAIRNDIGAGLTRCNVTKNDAGITVAAGGTFYSGTAAAASEGNL